MSSATRFVWPLILSILACLLGIGAVKVMAGPAKSPGDFVQEWLSARDVIAGKPAYSPLREALARHADSQLLNDSTGLVLKWNAHPPAAVLLTLPFGLLDYRAAILAWNILQMPLLVLAVGLLVYELGGRVDPLWHVPLGLCAAFYCYPLISTIEQGQLNITLLALIVVAWWADRRGLAVAAGAALGAAAALKLFPAFLFLYFVLRGRWRAAIVGVITFVFANGLAALVLGPDAFQTYIKEVLPSLERYRSEWQNLAPAAIWQRFFDPHPVQPIVPILRSKLLAEVGVWSTRILLLAWVIRYLLRTRRDDSEGTFAVVLAGMVALGPVTWSHSYVLLLPCVMILWRKLPEGPNRRLFWWLTACLWLPNSLWLLPLGQARFEQITKLNEPAVSPTEQLLLALPNIMLAAFFWLTTRLKRE